jgi:hypothetical protein
VENPVAAEPEPGEKGDEQDDQPPRATPVGILLREKVGRLEIVDGLLPK